jgi:hypothetical protein
MGAILMIEGCAGCAASTAHKPNESASSCLAFCGGIVPFEPWTTSATTECCLAADGVLSDASPARFSQAGAPILTSAIWQVLRMRAVSLRGGARLSAIISAPSESRHRLVAAILRGELGI